MPRRYRLEGIGPKRIARNKVHTHHFPCKKRQRRPSFLAGSRIQPGDEKAMDNLARYIIRASFSQQRMTYPRMNPMWSTDPRMARMRRPLTRWSGLPQCLPVRVRTQTGIRKSPTRQNRWSGTTVITATSLAANGRKKARIPSYLRSLNLMDQ